MADSGSNRVSYAAGRPVWRWWRSSCATTHARMEDGHSRGGVWSVVWREVSVAEGVVMLAVVAVMLLLLWCSAIVWYD
jgi:hypothetical protein